MRQFATPTPLYAGPLSAPSESGSNVTFGVPTTVTQKLPTSVNEKIPAYELPCGAMSEPPSEQPFVPLCIKSLNSTGPQLGVPQEEQSEP